MANQEHVDILRQGVEVWNKWREKHKYIGPDLYNAELDGVDLRKFDLHNANLSGAEFVSANLSGANLSGTILDGAELDLADLSEANLSNACLMFASLYGANLSGADLTMANFNEVNLMNANLTGCQVYGISVWNIDLEGAVQKDIVINNDHDEPEITVDNIEVAQFIYLLLNNQKIRNIIDTITSKVVLILGRFTDERKKVLYALKDELRNYNYSPVVFDFEPSASRNLTETVSLLANMSRFVIADLTNAKSIPQELQAIVPYLSSVPIQPIIHINDKEYAMFESLANRCLPIFRYKDIPSLLASINDPILKSIGQKEHEKDKIKVLEEENRKLKEMIKELENK